MVILRTRNKITDFLMILAWVVPLNKLDKQLSTQCGPTLIFKQVLGHPYCDNNYAALLVECRLYIYVIMQQSSIKRDNMSLKKDVGH